MFALFRYNKYNKIHQISKNHVLKYEQSDIPFKNQENIYWKNSRDLSHVVLCIVNFHIFVT